MAADNTSPAEVYRSFASYYDAYVGDFRGDFNIYLSLLYPGARPLEIGCGTGRLLQPALEQGYQITGIDISDDMLARAREKLGAYIEPGRLTLLNHNLVEAPLAELYGPAWVSFYTFNYLLDKQEARSFLDHLYHSMGEGETMVMDLFCPSALQQPSQQGQWTLREIMLGEQSVKLHDSRTLQGRVEKRIQIFESAEGREEIVTFRRFWDKREILVLLGQSGFKRIMFTDGYHLEGFRQCNLLESTSCSFVVKACK